MVMEGLSCVLHILVLVCTLRQVRGFLDPGWIESSFRLKGNASKHTVTFAKSLYPQTNIIVDVECKRGDGNGMMATFYIEGLLSYQHCQSKSNYEENLPDNTWVGMELKCLSASIPLRYVEKLLGRIRHSYTHFETNHMANNSSPPFRDNQLTQNRGFYRLDLVFSHLRHAESGNFNVFIEAHGSNGFLSVVDWPVLPFHAAMSLIFLGLGIMWFIAMCRSWSTILDIQLWMFSVIVLGLLEHLLFYIVYRNLNQSGEVVRLLYFAVISCCGKHTVAYASIMLICRGYGMVRPQNRRTLAEVIGVVAVYFILGTIEMVCNSRNARFVGKDLRVMTPLTVLQILMWIHIFLCIYRTRKILFIRQDKRKLTLYLRFLFILIFVVLFQLSYMTWIIRESLFTDCVDVEVLWLIEMIPSCMFLLVLCCITWLWKPNATNELYAFQPLDVEDYAEEDMAMSRYTVHDTYKNSKS